MGFDCREVRFSRGTLQETAGDSIAGGSQGSSIKNASVLSQEFFVAFPPLNFREEGDLLRSTLAS